jgi:hypothetical protein
LPSGFVLKKQQRGTDPSYSDENQERMFARKLSGLFGLWPHNGQGCFDEILLPEDDCDITLRRPSPGTRAETFQNSKLTIGSTVSSRPEAFRNTILRRFPDDEQ